MIPAPAPLDRLKRLSVYLMPSALLLGGLLGAALRLEARPQQANQRANRQSRIVSHGGDVAERAAGTKFHPTRILVRYKDGTSRQTMMAVHAAAQAQLLRELPIVKGLHAVEIGAGRTIAETLQYYRKDPNVLYAEPDYYVHIVAAPNDPQFSSQWSLQNTGQSGGTVGADIHAVQAWGLSTGSANVVVGVLDTGVDYNHPDLAANIWTSPAGFTATTAFGEQVQCPAGTHGFNMVAATCDPLDDNGHGTHVSGTIGALGNNGAGVAGINWQVQILPCKFLNIDGGGFTEAAIACLGLMKQLKDSGVNIVVTNNSWGGGDSSQALHDAIVSAMLDGMLFVAAAGNDFANNDVFPTYPANFYVPNIISVAATDRNDTVVTFSNVGRRTVHIAAPGRDILSTLPNNSYGMDSGTSMATPHVTGVAALLKAQNPNLDWRGIKNLILSGGDTNASAQQTITQKRLNAYGAMTCTNGAVAARVIPVPQTISASAGSPVTLAFENVRCAQPAGNVSAKVTPGNVNVALLDDGNGADQAAGDGIYTAQWTPSQPGSYSIAFPDGSSVTVEVLTAYGAIETAFNYRTISGTNLNLGDDAVATVTSPFIIPFGGGAFTKLFVSSNGTISFTEPFDVAQNFGLEPNQFPSGFVAPNTLVAPMWQDLYPLKGTNQNVFWAVTGGAPNRELVVEWRNVLAFACRDDASRHVTFQVVFKENSSDVLFNYSDIVFGGNCSNDDYGQVSSTGILSSPTQGSNWNLAAAPALSNGFALLWQSPAPTGPANPVPTLASVTPGSVRLYSPDTMIAITGTNFVPNSSVRLVATNIFPVPPPIELPTTYVSSTQLAAILPAEFAAPNNRYSFGSGPAMVVVNPGPSGGQSNSILFHFDYPGVPSIASLSPNTAVAGDFSQYMIVQGDNMYSVKINWNGSALETIPISTTAVYASVPSGLLGAPGIVPVTAVPTFGNTGPSAPVNFTITQPSPLTLPALGAANSPALQGTGESHETMNSDGTSYSGKKMKRPVRFLGWNYGQKFGGPAYLKHFSRGYGSAPVAPASNASAAANGSAEANAASSQSVSLSQPSSLPGFAFHPTLPAGFLPTSIATADFNRDGKMDWIVSNGGTSDLWIYFGNGDGTAQLPKIIRLTGAGPIQVFAADLRKNGMTDLIVAEADSQTVGVLLGNGDGTFQPEVTYFVPGPPLCVAVADLNGDGKPDIVAGIIGDERIGPLATLRGDGTGKFGAPITTPGYNPNEPYLTVRVVLKDLNGDGLPDLALIDEGDLNMAGGHTYVNNGDGTFKHADYFLEADPIFPTDLALADMDGDACADVVTVEIGGTAEIFKGTCDGNVQGFPNVKGLGAGEAAISVRIADMNGDGKLDIVASGGAFGVDRIFGEEASNLVTVLLGDGSGNFATPQVYRAEPSLVGLALVDLNGDGKPDVIAASQDTDTALVMMNNGQGKLDGPTGHYVGYLTEGQFGASNAPFTSFFVQDLNGDGKLDLAFVGYPQTFSQPWQLVTMLNDGTGHFGSANRAPLADFDFAGTAPLSYVFADLHGTGKPDLVTVAQGYQGQPNVDLIMVPNNGDGTFGRAKVTPLSTNQFLGMTLIAPGDFNHDGKTDMVGIAYGPQPAPGQPGPANVAFFAGNGDGTLQAPKFTPLGSSIAGAPTMIFSGDFNRDGKLDVLIWTNSNGVPSADHNVYEFLGNADGTFSAPKLLLSNVGPFGEADLNHDGFPDLVVFNQIPAPQLNGFLLPSFTIYIGKADGTFAKGETYAPYSGIMASGYGFSNVGPDQSLAPMLADFNGDGNIDIGVVMFTPDANTGSYLQVIAGNGDGTFTPTYEVTRFDKLGLPSNAADVNGDGRAELLELDGWPASFNVIPAIAGQAVQLAFASRPIVGPKGTVVVNLSLPVPASTTVQLSASDPNISIAPNVPVAAGALTTTVPFTIGGGFNAKNVFSITGQLNGTTSTIYSYQAPSGLAGFHLFSNSPKQLTPPGGTTADFGVGVNSVGGYAGTAQLTCKGLPAGAKCVFGTNPLLIVPGQSLGSGLTVQTSSTTPLGTYNVMLVATDGAITDTMALVLKVADFSVSVTPPSTSLLAGGNINYSMQLTTASGWTDPVSVSCSINGPGIQTSCDASGSFTPETFPFTVNTAGFSAGDYTLGISASADGVTHSASAVIHIEGAQAALSPPNASVSVGGSATFNATLTSQNGFTDQFTFSCLGLPAGVSCSFNPASAPLPANGTLTSALTVTVTSRPAFAPIARVPWRFPPFNPLPWLALLAAIAFVAAAQLKSKRAHSAWPSASSLATGGALAMALAIAACGGGSSSSPPPPPPPPVNVTVTVQASSPSLSVIVGTANLRVK